MFEILFKYCGVPYLPETRCDHMVYLQNITVYHFVCVLQINSVKKDLILSINFHQATIFVLLAHGLYTGVNF